MPPREVASSLQPSSNAAGISSRGMVPVAEPKAPSFRVTACALHARIKASWGTLIRAALLGIGSCVLTLAAIAPSQGVESDPLAVPKGSPREQAVGLYNDGVRLMLERNYGAAQQKFEAALALEETLAEAHNNLAFSLRRQSAAHNERALKHYNRALALKPTLAAAYAYRGALFVQLKQADRARADHDRLSKLDPKLAARLKRIIDGEAEGDAFDGLAAQYE